MDYLPRAFLSRCRHGMGTLALAAFVHCGGPGAVRSNAPVRLHSTASPVVQSLDLSEVPAPANLVLVIRTAPPARLAARIDALIGQRQLARGQLEELYHLQGAALSAVLDRTAPLDIAVTMDSNGNTRQWISFGAGSMDEVERALAQSYRLALVPNGIRRLESVGPDSTPGDEDGAGASMGVTKCVVAPTPRPSMTRVICVDHPGTSEGMEAFLSRTLPRHEVPADTITFDLPGDALRTMVFRPWLRETDQARGWIDQKLTSAQGAPFSDPGTRDAAATLGRDLTDSARSLAADVSGVSGSLTLSSDRAAFHVTYDLRNPSGNLLRGLAGSLQAQSPVAPEMLAKLLPGGWLYAAGSLNEASLQPTFAQLRSLGELIAQHLPRLNAGDRAALRPALEALATLGQTTGAFVVGSDDRGRMWLAGTAREASVTPAQVAGRYRAMLTALRRPNVLRVIQQSDLRGFTPTRELPVRGLPAGSVGFVLPALDALSSSANSLSPSPSLSSPGRVPAGRRGRSVGHATGLPRGNAGENVRGPESPLSAILEVLMVPVDQDLVVAVGPDARVIYNRWQANQTAGIEARALDQQGAAVAVAVVPAGLPNMIRATSVSQAQSLSALLALLPDRGRTPVIARLASGTPDGLTRFVIDAEVAQETIQAALSAVVGVRPPPNNLPPASVPQGSNQP